MRIHQDIKGTAYKGLVHSSWSKAVRSEIPRCSQEELESMQKCAARFITLSSDLLHQMLKKLTG